MSRSDLDARAVFERDIDRRAFAQRHPVVDFNGLDSSISQPEGVLPPVIYELTDGNHAAGVGVYDSRIARNTFPGGVCAMNSTKTVWEFEVQLTKSAIIPERQRPQVH